MSRATRSTRDRLRLRREASPAIKETCAILGDALFEKQLPVDLTVGMSMVALGLEVLEQHGRTRELLLKFCERVLDAPASPDPRAHTGGT